MDKDKMHIAKVHVFSGQDDCVMLSLTDICGTEYQLDLGYATGIDICQSRRLDIELRYKEIKDRDKAAIDDLFKRIEGDFHFSEEMQYNRSRVYIVNQKTNRIPINIETEYSCPRIALHDIGLLVGNAPAGLHHRGTTIYLPVTEEVPSDDMCPDDFNDLFNPDNAVDFEHEAFRRIIVNQLVIWRNWDDFPKQNGIRINWCGRPKDAVLELKDPSYKKEVLKMLKEAKIPYQRIMN